MLCMTCQSKRGQGPLVTPRLCPFDLCFAVVDVFDAVACIGSHLTMTQKGNCLTCPAKAEQGFQLSLSRRPIVGDVTALVER